MPHKNLNSTQKHLIHEKYMGGTTAQVFEVRNAMARYLIKNFNAAVDAEQDISHSHLLMVDQPEELPPGTFR